MSAPELIHVGSMKVGLAEDMHIIPGGPKGTRVVADVTSIELEGERIRASMLSSAAADWLTLSPDSSYGTLDVRGTLKTDDGAVIYVEYSGKIDLASGRVISAPTFQTGDERYDWMNRAQFIGDGTNSPETGLVYEIYEVRPT